jgi:uncharacterized protein (TIGR02391 family)
MMTVNDALDCASDGAMSKPMLFYDYLHSVFPDPNELLELPSEELGRLILQYAKVGAGRRDAPGRNIFGVSVQASIAPYTVERAFEIIQAVSQARSWLISEQFITRAPGQGEDYISLTPKGWQTDTSESLDPYMQSKLLNRALLHPKIADRAWEHFRSGRYDEAILAAFKEIEIAVRTAGNFTSSDYGVALMNAAFNPQTGRLHDPSGVDPNATQGERAAWANLFAGAIGVHKNPQSHRWVGIDAAVPAMEALVIASHLYRLLEVRLAALGLPAPP